MLEESFLWAAKNVRRLTYIAAPKYTPSFIKHLNIEKTNNGCDNNIYLWSSQLWLTFERM